MDSKIETFRESVAKAKNIIVCVKCGSTLVDQNSIHSLRCYSCGNIGFWDSKRFAIARESEEHDAVRAFRSEGKIGEAVRKTWREEMLSGVEPLAHMLPEMPLIMHAGYGQIRRKDFDALARQWAETKALIDGAFKKLLASESLIIDSEE